MPSQCIFCNSQDLTEEDIWPVWFKKWLSRHPKLKSDFTLTRMQDGETTILHPHSQTVGGKRAIMCGRCNNKRLGRIQERASVIIKPMLDHPFDQPADPIVLAPTDQRVLATWAAMTALTTEFLPLPMPNNDETYFSQEERAAIRRNRKPLRGMHVTASQYFGQHLGPGCD